MLNWIARNRTVLIFKLYSYAKLNYLRKTVLTLTLCITLSAGAVEYTDCTSAEGKKPPTHQQVSLIWH